MVAYFVLGIALLAGLLLTARWFAAADPKTLARVLKWLAFILIVGVVVFMALTGRLAWALFVLPALLPWFLRLRALARTAKNFARMAGGARAATGHSSEVETRFLRMALDHDSGAMDGEVIDGAYSGRRLGEMALDELVDLLRTCRTEDEQSAQVLEAYLDRVHPDWRQRAEAGERSGAGAGGGAMSPEEARQVLGLDAGAGEKEIREAYHRLIAGLHPDHGGSTYLAAKINQAKDVLLGS